MVTSIATGRIRLLAVAAGLALAAVLAFRAQAASALTPTPCPLTGSAFQAGDGNQLPENPLSCPATSPLTAWHDWKDVTGTAGEGLDDNAVDSTFQSGSKEDQPSTWTLSSQAGGVTPGKDNILSAFEMVDTGASGPPPLFLYLAFHRASTSSADTFMDFELNQVTTVWNNGNSTIPCRTDGDILISYEIHPGSAVDPVDVNMYRWDGSGGPTGTTGPGTSPCPDGATGTFTQITDAGLVQGAMNFAGNALTAADQPAGGSAGDINNYVDTANNGSSFSAGTFGEAGVNLTDTIGIGNQPCFDFGQIQMHSRSAESLSSNLNDYVSPIPLSLGSCGVGVDKKERRAGDPTYVDGPIDAHVGDTVQYQFTVTNTGSQDLNVTFDDPGCDSAATLDSGDTNNDSKLQPTETWTYSCSHVLTANDVTNANKTFTNTVTVTGLVPGCTGGVAGGCGATDTDSVDARAITPGIGIVKTERRQGDPTYAAGPVDAHVGDTIEYELTLTNTGDTPLSVALTDAGCDSAATLDSGDSNNDNLLDVTETWVYHCSHVLTAADMSNPSKTFTNTASVTGTDMLGGTANDSSSADAQAVGAGIAVDKTERRGTSGAFVNGPIDAHVGDTIEYQLTVTNVGNAPLSVNLSDPRCDAGTLSGPSGDANSNSLLDTSETWTYTCSHVLTAADGDTFTNTVNVTGTDPLGGTANASDSADAHAVRPGIAVDKKERNGSSGDYVDGPVTATVGDTLQYQFTVANTGSTTLAVTFSDSLCDAGTLSGPSGDANGDGALQVGETFSYTCSHRLTANDAGTFTNTVNVCGGDSLGGNACASDSVSATAAQQVVLGEQPGDVSLAGLTGCVPKKFKAKITGHRIQQVVFRIDGRRKATLTKPNSGSAFTLTIDPKKFKPGSHLLTVTTTFVPAANTPTRTQRLRFSRCVKRRAPAFTG